jgi:hypothetical protein
MPRKIDAENLTFSGFEGHSAQVIKSQTDFIKMQELLLS